LNYKFFYIWILFLEDNRKVEIVYDLVAENFVRMKSKPFEKDKDNNLVFIYDNYMLNNSIEDVSLSIHLQNKMDKDNIIGFPDIFSVYLFFYLFLKKILCELI